MSNTISSDGCILRINEVGPDDFEEWSQMVLDYSGRIDEIHATWAKIHSAWNEGQGARFIMQGETLVGFLHFKEHEFFFGKAPICYLADLYIKPEYRRQGYARRALEWLIDHVRSLNYGRLHWYTHKDNGEARGLYDSLASCEFVLYHTDFIDGM